MMVLKNGEGREFPLWVQPTEYMDAPVNGQQVSAGVMQDLGYDIDEASPKPTLAEAWADGFSEAVRWLRPGDRQFYEFAMGCEHLANPHKAKI